MTWLDQFWRGLRDDFFDLPDGAVAGQVVGRLLVAAAAGAALGYNREVNGKAAGLRTHILVALSAAFFVAVAMQSGMSTADVSRIIQGLAAGVGFLGAGAIIKQPEEGRVVGLTTAASLYFATAVGVAAGLGRDSTALVGTVLALGVLAALPRPDPAAGDRAGAKRGKR